MPLISFMLQKVTGANLMNRNGHYKNEGWAALKIRDASPTKEKGVQAKAFQMLLGRNQTGLGGYVSPHIVELYDWFLVRRENTEGNTEMYHEVLAMEVILPLCKMCDVTSPPQFVWQKVRAKSIIRQLFKGFDYIKKAGVTHGGKQPGPHWYRILRLIVGVQPPE